MGNKDIYTMSLTIKKQSFAPILIRFEFKRNHIDTTAIGHKVNLWQFSGSTSFKNSASHLVG